MDTLPLVLRVPDSTDLDFSNRRKMSGMPRDRRWQRAWLVPARSCWPPAITPASTSTASSRDVPLAARPRWAGSMAQKLHLVGNSEGDLLAFCLTPGKVDDRHPVPTPARRLFGTLFGDKGYVSQPLAEQLLVTQGLRLITKLRKQMHNRLLLLSDKLLLRKRAIIETINDQLKNI